MSRVSPASQQICRCHCRCSRNPAPPTTCVEAESASGVSRVRVWSLRKKETQKSDVRCLHREIVVSISIVIIFRIPHRQMLTIYTLVFHAHYIMIIPLVTNCYRNRVRLGILERTCVLLHDPHNNIENFSKYWASYNDHPSNHIIGFKGKQAERPAAGGIINTIHHATSRIHLFIINHRY